MLSSAGLVLLTCLGVVTALTYHSEVRNAECGGEIEKPGLYRLPDNARCSIVIKVPSAKAVDMFFVKNGRRYRCSENVSLRVVNMENEEQMISVCDEKRRVMMDGNSKVYFNGLPTGVKLDISFYDTIYQCGETIPIDVSSVQLKLIVNDDKCILKIPPRSRITIQEDDIENDECKKKIQYFAGQTYKDLEAATSTMCLGESEPFEQLCTAGAMRIDNAVGEFIKFRMTALPLPRFSFSDMNKKSFRRYLFVNQYCLYK